MLVRTLTAVLVAMSIGGCVRVQSSSTPIGVERQAPGFSLPDHQGGEASLDSLHAERPAVLVFYRGSD